MVDAMPKAGGQRPAQVAPWLHATRISQVLGNALDIVGKKVMQWARA